MNIKKWADSKMDGKRSVSCPIWMSDPYEG